MKCLLRIGKSLLGLAVRIDYLGKSRFSGVWEEEARLQWSEIESLCFISPGEKETHRSSLIISGLEPGTAWVLVLDVAVCDPKTLCGDATKLCSFIRSLLCMPVVLLLIEILRLFICVFLFTLTVTQLTKRTNPISLCLRRVPTGISFSGYYEIF